MAVSRSQGGGSASRYLVGIVIGLINGLLITRLNVAPFIATLGTLYVARGAALLLSGGATFPNLVGHADLGNSGGSSGGRRSAKARATLTCTLVNGVEDRGVKGCECIEAAVRPEWTLLLRVVACFLSLTHRVGRASSKGLLLHARREGRNAGLLWKPPAWRSSSSVPLAAFLAIDGQTFA